jgi:hypothetical protein
MPADNDDVYLILRKNKKKAKAKANTSKKKSESKKKNTRHLTTFYKKCCST